LFVTAQSMLRAERSRDKYARRRQRIERMRQVHCDTSRVRNKADSAAFQKREQAGVLYQPINAKLHSHLLRQSVEIVLKGLEQRFEQ
jgi:hypothetical protein